jgi:hypothetical protein
LSVLEFPQVSQYWHASAEQLPNNRLKSCTRRVSPLTFVENMGQTAEQVRFLSHGSGYELFLTEQNVVLTLNPRTTT